MSACGREPDLTSRAGCQVLRCVLCILRLAASLQTTPSFEPKKRSLFNARKLGSKKAHSPALENTGRQRANNAISGPLTVHSFRPKARGSAGFLGCQVSAENIVGDLSGRGKGAGNQPSPLMGDAGLSQRSAKRWRTAIAVEDAHRRCLRKGRLTGGEFLEAGRPPTSLNRFACCSRYRGLPRTKIRR